LEDCCRRDDANKSISNNTGAAAERNVRDESIISPIDATRIVLPAVAITAGTLDDVFYNAIAMQQKLHHM